MSGSKKLASAAGETSKRAARRAASKALQKISTTVSSFPESKLTQALRERLPQPEPEPPRGLFYIAHLAVELFKRVESRSIFVLPGGVAFFFLLALFPATAAIASFYGLVSDTSELVNFSRMAGGYLPAPIAGLVQDGLARVEQSPTSSLGLSAIIAMFFTLMSANWGTKALCESLNIIFDRRDMRTYVQFTAITLLITTTTIVIMAAYAWFSLRIFAWEGTAFTKLAGPLPLWLEGIGLWLLLTLMIGTIYRYGPAPDPKKPLTPVLSAGAFFAAASVIAASWLLARQFMTSDTFVRNFGALSSVAAIVIWTWIIVVVILIGAEIVAIRQDEAGLKRKERRRLT